MKCSKCGAPSEPVNGLCQYCQSPIDNKTSVTNNNVTPLFNQKEQSRAPLNNNQTTTKTQNNNINNNNQSYQQTNNGYYNQQNIQYTKYPAYNQFIEKPKDKNKTIITILTIAILLVVISTIAICLIVPSLKKEPTELKEVKGTRTIMIYMVGSDLESRDGAASMDIAEMQNADFDEDILNVVIYTGGAKKWQNSEISANENAIYEIADGKLNKVKKYSQKNMSKSSTLTEFIDYVYENYETDLYDLILWNHGGGPLLGYGVDEVASSDSSDMLTLEELNEALEDSKITENKKLEMLGFDACLMASIEVAYNIRDYANYFIASEDLEPGYGWDYNYLSAIKEDTTSEELGKLIIDGYFDFYEEIVDEYELSGYKYNPNLTLSLIDLQKVSNVVTYLDDIFENVNGDISVSNYSSFTRNTSKAPVFGYSGNAEQSYDLVDLYSLIKNLEDDYGNTSKLLTSIKEAVVYNKSNIDNSNGLTIYFPSKNKSYSQKFTAQYSSFNFSKNYINFLNKYVGILNGNKLVKSNSLQLLPAIDTTSYKVSVTLPDDLVSNYLKSEYVIFRKMEDDLYMPVYKASDTVLNGNVLNVKSSNQQMVVTNLDGTDPGWVTMFEETRNDEYTIYCIYAILERYSNGIETVATGMRYKIKNGETEGEIIDILPLNGANSPIGKSSYDLKDWEVIVFPNFQYKIFDETGAYLPQAESSGLMHGSQVRINEGFKFMFTELDSDSEYYYRFHVYDTQGVAHYTQLVSFQKK